MMMSLHGTRRRRRRRRSMRQRFRRRRQRRRRGGIRRGRRGRRRRLNRLPPESKHFVSSSSSSSIKSRRLSFIYVVQFVFLLSESCLPEYILSLKIWGYCLRTALVPRWYSHTLN